LGIDDKLQRNMKNRRAVHICAGMLCVVVHVLHLFCIEVQVNGCCQMKLVSKLKSHKKPKKTQQTRL